jgi:hypothetical protein
VLNATAEIYLNGITELDIKDYGGLYIYHFLDTGLPYGYFFIKDRGGKYLHDFENLQLGAKVDITLVDTQEVKNTITFPTFYILKVEDDFAFDPSKFSGSIKVWFGHPWFLFKDTNNHAFDAMNNSKLIKKVLESTDRGLKFEINKNNFLESDDSGKVNRYKVAETDWDFIKNKLIPFSTIQKLPPLFYCSLSKKKEETKYKFAFNFTNSATLYKQNPKIMISPSQEALVEDGAFKEIEKICKKNNLDPNADIYYIQTLKLRIISENDIIDVASQIYTENIETNKGSTVKKSINNNLSGTEGSSFGNLVPIDILYMTASLGTSVKLIKNRSLTDALTLSLSNGKNFDNIFLSIVEINFVGDKVTIGDTIEFFVPAIMENDKPKESWFRGKWLLSGIENYSDSANGDSNKLLSKLYLSRPSFVGDFNKTTLKMYQTLLEV